MPGKLAPMGGTIIMDETKSKPKLKEVVTTPDDQIIDVIADIRGRGIPLTIWRISIYIRENRSTLREWLLSRGFVYAGAKGWMIEDHWAAGYYLCKIFNTWPESGL
jgi:hypothetical protein